MKGKMELNKMIPSPAEQAGKWFEWDDSRLLIASINSQRFQDVLQIKRAPYKAQIRRNSMNADTAERLATEAMAETILLGWENVTEAGKPIEFSAAAAKEMMLKYPRFSALVAEFAMNEAAFQATLDDEGKENLGKG